MLGPRLCGDERNTALFAMNYLKDPAAIYERSFAIIGEEADVSGLPEPLRPIALRLIHSCGMSDVLADLRLSEGLLTAVRAAVAAGRPILTDCEMLRSAIIRRQLPKETEIVCLLNDPAAAERGRSEKITRSAAAVSLWEPCLGGAVAVIGNAPTALFALLELIDAGAPKPAAIVAFPVGFVGAAEAKAELAANPRGIPFATLLGRRGGSGMAAAVINAIFAGSGT
jgi:precorrin-8X/cobalt-precorrin-8 methylmutase